MTAMRTGIYALLAIVIGITLVGFLPNQLTSMITPQLMSSTPQKLGESTSRNLTDSQLYDKNNTYATGTVAGTKSDAAKAAAGGEHITTSVGSGLANDIGYYGLWLVNLIVALGIYLIAKRLLV